MQKEESQAEGTQTRKPSLLPTTNYIYSLCSRDCHSRIGLTRHRQFCSSRNTTISYGTLLRQNKSAQSPKKPILICFGKFLVLKLARTYDELNKYPKKKRFCVTGNLILVIAQSKIIQNRKRLKRLKFA